MNKRFPALIALAGVLVLGACEFGGGVFTPAP